MKAPSASSSHWPESLCTVALPSWALNGAPLFGITCKHDRYTPCQVPRLLTRGCCGSPLVPSHQAIHDPSTTPLSVKLSSLCGFYFSFLASSCAPLQTITSHLRRIMWETVTKAMTTSRWRTSAVLHLSTSTAMVSQNATVWYWHDLSMNNPCWLFPATFFTLFPQSCAPTGLVPLFSHTPS